MVDVSWQSTNTINNRNQQIFESSTWIVNEHNRLLVNIENHNTHHNIRNHIQLQVYYTPPWNAIPGSYNIMIHLQVHLQIPCYDFICFLSLMLAAPLHGSNSQQTQINRCDRRCVQRAGTHSIPVNDSKPSRRSGFTSLITVLDPHLHNDYHPVSVRHGLLVALQL